MKIQGIDVSEFQGDIDFGKVRDSGIDFVIVRAGYGRLSSQTDIRFAENYARAKAAGLKVGAYWYSYAVNPQGAAAEAEACLDVIKGRKFDYPIYFDLEEKKAFAQGKNVCSEMVRTFCNALEKAGYFAGLYISRSPLQTHITEEIAGRYALWVAEYDEKLHYSGAYGIWQHTNSHRVDGIRGDVDHNYCYIDYPAIIERAGLNGYQKGAIEPEQTQKQKEILYTVQKGDTLTAIAGRFGTTIESIAKKNGIRNVNLIYAGQKLRI